MELNLGFFASHNGSNVSAILNNIRSGYLKATPKVVISNNFDSNVIKTANNFNIPGFIINNKTIETYVSRYGCSDKNEVILEILKKNEVNLIILAGYMQKIDEKVIEAYNNRILNIHPALLPKYGGKGMYGMNVHEEVIKSLDKESGATVHLVDKEYDKGRILGQAKVPRYEKDTAESLASRVLRFEHALYSQVLKDIQVGIIDLDAA